MVLKKIMHIGSHIVFSHMIIILSGEYSSHPFSLLYLLPFYSY